MSNTNSTEEDGEIGGEDRERLPTGGLARMGLAPDELSDIEKRFVTFYVSNGKTAGNAMQSALAAGYAKKSAPVTGARVLERPRVIAAIDAALREAIGSRLTVKAVAVIEEILDSPDASLKLKGEMAAKIVEFSGLVERTKREKAEKTGFGQKPLAEMSRAELEAVVAQGAAVLRAAGKVEVTIDGQARLSAQDSAQVEDAKLE